MSNIFLIYMFFKVPKNNVVCIPNEQFYIYNLFNTDKEDEEGRKENKLPMSKSLSFQYYYNLQQFSGTIKTSKWNTESLHSYQYNVTHLQKQ